MAGVKVDSGPHAAFTGSKRLQLNTQVKVKGGGRGGGGRCGLPFKDQRNSSSRRSRTLSLLADNLMK